MLNVFKKRVLKFATYILFGILILSFGIWGIGDHIPGARQAASQIVATVGDHDITRHEVGREVSQQIRRFRQLLGTNIDATQAREMGLLDAALENIVQRDLLTIGANDLGLLIGDDVVRGNIQTDERFRTPQGAFNRVAFDQALRSNGLTEAGYVALLRNTLLRQQYLSGLDAGEALPSTMVNQVYRATGTNGGSPRLFGWTTPRSGTSVNRIRPHSGTFISGTPPGSPRRSTAR